MTKVRTLLEIKYLLDGYKQESLKDTPSSHPYQSVLRGAIYAIYDVVNIIARNDGYQKLSDEKLTDYVDRFFEEAS
jgi:hypothetical protein